jgi:hypothetical protein
MSIDQNVRLLPYVEIEAKERLVEQSVIADCCGHSMSYSTFCPHCGKIRQKIKKLVPYNYSFEISEKLDERLYCPFHDEPNHRWIASITPENYTYVEPDTSQTGVYPLPDPEQVKAEFARAFAAEIEVLRKEYNAEPVIKFGLLVWFS